MKIGIALSGGGIRGIAHLGVLKVLKDKGLTISYISGTSAGSIAGALYANNIDPYEALGIFKTSQLLKLIKLAVGSPGLLNLEYTYSFFKEYLPHDSFEDLQIPLTITATNFFNGKLTYFNKGTLINKILASSCVPGVFNPININGVLYIDGGVLNNFPVEPLIDKCDYIIGSSCNHIPDITAVKGTKHVIERAASLTINHDVEQKLKLINVLIQPYGLGEIGTFEVAKAEEIYWKAYEETLKTIERSEDLTNIIKAHQTKKAL